MDVLVRKPTVSERARVFRKEWPRSATRFIEVLMIAWGAVFVTDPLTGLVKPDSGWARWGEGTVVIIGAAFIILGLWGALWPEQGGGVVATFFIATLGVIISFKPFSPIGLVFYFWLIYGAVADAPRFVRGKRVDGTHVDGDTG
jgi:hypothetical protein